MIWARSAGDYFYDEAIIVKADARGNIYMAGQFGSSSISFGSYVLPNEGVSDIFLAKYDTNGNVLWAKSAGGWYEDIANSVAIDASGNIFVAGLFNSPKLDLGSYTLLNKGSDDIFLAKSAGNDVGINEMNNLLNNTVYPNPGANTITLKASGKGSISILTMRGQQLLQKEITEPSTTIDLSTLPSGIYDVRLTSDGTVQNVKFVKQ